MQNHFNRFFIFQERFKSFPTDFLNLIKSEVDERFYFYGDHFRRHSDEKILNFLKGILVFILSLSKKKRNNVILSTAYYEVDNLLLKRNWNVSRPWWRYNIKAHNIYSFNLYRLSKLIHHKLKNDNLNQLFSFEFQELINSYKTQVIAFLKEKEVKAVILSNDQYFNEKILIEAAKLAGIPTFVFAHGFLFYSTPSDFLLADYLVVWGKISKDNFLSNGVRSDKIIVSGNPKRYMHVDRNQEFKFSFENVVVLTNSLNGILPNHPYEDTLSDRSNCIAYLEEIRFALEQFGVKNAYLKTHPSENPKWYKKMMGCKYYKIIDGPIEDILLDASLVIGPSSTVLFDSLCFGVNYIVYNPRDFRNNGYAGHPLNSFFAGKDARVPVAASTEDLIEILKSKNSIKTEILDELGIDDLNLESLELIIKKYCE